LLESTLNEVNMNVVVAPQRPSLDQY